MNDFCEICNVPQSMIGQQDLIINCEEYFSPILSFVKNNYDTFNMSKCKLNFTSFFMI